MAAEERAHALDELVKVALDLGLDDAQVITTGKIVVDERVWYKCLLTCRGANSGLHCPPHTLTPSQTRELLKNYSHALLVRKRGTPEDFSGLSDLPDSHVNRNTLGLDNKQLGIIRAQV